MYYDNFGMVSHTYYPFAWFFDVLWHVIVIVLLVMLLIRLIRGPRRGGRHHMYSMWHANSAISLLDERYAKGEISKEEYEERKKTLLG